MRDEEADTTMRLRIVVLAIFVITTILLVTIIDVVSYNALSKSYGNLEKTEVDTKIGQIQGAISNQFSTLGSKLSDWAAWDDAYSFAQDSNTAGSIASSYVANDLITNIGTGSIANFGVNFIINVNSTGTLTYGIGLNLVNATTVPIPQSMRNLISTTPEIWNFHDPSSNFTGLAVTPEGALIIASRPILAGDGGGAVVGALVFARYFDNQFVQELSNTLRLPLTMQLYQDWQSANPSGTVISTAPSHYERAINSSYIAGYYVLDDINNQPAVVIGTILPRTTFHEGLATIYFVDASVIIASAVFGVSMLMLMRRTVLSPIGRLVNELNKIRKSGERGALVSTKGSDEITSVGSSINELLRENERNTSQLRKSERFSAIGELSAMVAHDLRNPLQGIANAAFFLQKTEPAGTKQMEMVNVIQDGVKYSEKIVNDLLDYSREIRLETSETDPRHLVEQTLSMLRVPQGVKVTDLAHSDPPLTVDAQKIMRTMANIISNSFDAMPNGGTLDISSRTEGGRVEIGFKDSGVGMSPETLSKIFTPLYTSKAKGMGFGLAICKRIVEAHGGSIRVDSAPGRGTTFTISLPLNPAVIGVNEA